MWRKNEAEIGEAQEATTHQCFGSLWAVAMSSQDLQVGFVVAPGLVLAPGLAPEPGLEPAPVLEPVL